MKLTVISPCYQEIRFIRGWLENCRLFADEVIISEGGSTDGTREVIADFSSRFPGWIRVLEHPQDANPQLNLWNEPVRRRALAEAVTDGYMIALDVDEMLPDDARAQLECTLSPKYEFALIQTQFWRSPRYIRVGVPGDEHWGPIGKVCIFPAGTVTVGDEPNHARWHCALPRFDLPVRKFHLHYLFARAKVFENRIAEAKGAVELAPAGGIHLQLVNFKLPSAIRFLSETVNYGDWL
jgi:glycosyltransferase involved in cell wall biosynthesis